MNAVKIPYDKSLVTASLADDHVTGALMEVISRIDTLNYLASTFLRGEGGLGSDFSEGFHSLFDQQQLVLQAIANRVSVWEKERRDAAKAEEAERNGVADSVRKVREAFIAASAEAGTEPQVIAQALNIRRSSVERVIRQLRGAAPVIPEAARAVRA